VVRELLVRDEARDERYAEELATQVFRVTMAGFAAFVVASLFVLLS
jgi:hypothetical protein